MVRAVTSSSASGRSALLLGILAELTVARFFNECFKGHDPQVKLHDHDKVALTYAMALLSLIAETAQGWQLVPYINGQAIARMDGMDLADLYKAKRRGVLQGNLETEAALARVPESFIMAGHWYSSLSEMQTKGLRMTKAMFVKLFRGEIRMHEVLEQVKITDVEPLRFSDKFTQGCDCPSGEMKRREQPSPFQTSSGNGYAANATYHIHQGHNKYHPSKLTRFCAPNIGLLIYIMQCMCAAARFEKPGLAPNFSSSFELFNEIPRVTIYVSNKDDKSPLVNSRPLLKWIPQRKQITEQMASYLRMSCDNGPLWHQIRPLFAIANSAAVDFAMSNPRKGSNLVFSPFSPSFLKSEVASH